MVTVLTLLFLLCAPLQMEKSFRDKMFAKAGTRITPMLFVDDEYIGGWEEVAELDEAGQFERIMEY